MILRSAATGLVAAEDGDFTIRSWQTDDGLPQNSISAILQSRDGYLWLGTFNGLVRFDGVKFTAYTTANTPGLLSDNINSLLEDKAGRLWIGTEGGGLCLYQGSTISSLRASDPSGPAVVWHVIEDSRGVLWVGAPDGLYRLREEHLERATPPRYQRQDDWVHSMAVDGHGWLWVNVGNEMVRLREDRWEPVPDLQGSWQMRPDATNGLWLASGNRGLIHVVDGQTARLLELNGADVKHVSLTRDGEVWIATSRNGLIRFSQGSRQQLTASNGLLVDDIPVVHEDREGNIWVGSNGAGLHRLRKKVLRTISTRDGLPINDVVCLVQDQSGIPWIGTWGEGAGVWRDGRFSRLPDLPSAGANVLSMHATASGTIWLGDGDGVLYRCQNGGVTQRERIPGQGTRTIFEDRDGGLWLGSRDHGIQHRQQDRVTYFRPSDGLSHAYVTCIAQDKQGAIWIGTKQGLNRIEAGRIQQFHRGDGLGADPIHTLYPDQTGALWIGTAGGGLTRYLDGRFTTVTTRQGLVNDVVAQIVEDDFGYVWIGSNAGLMRVLRRDLESCLDGQSHEIHGVVLARTEGMLSAECAGSHQPACFKAPDGQLWFATVGGIVIVDPAKLATNALPPPVRVEYVRNDSDLTPTPSEASGHLSEILVPPGRERLEIGYTALSFPAPDRVRFRYRLSGWDKAWVDAGAQRAAYYTKVQPGAYRFQVTACNNDGVWNDTGATLSLVVQPFWWQTAAFQSCLALALAGLGLAGARALHLRKLRRALARADQTAARLRAAELGAANAELQARTSELESALASVKVLRGLIPICASCKKVRDDKGYWSQVEVYVMRHSEAQFSHGICPDCAKTFLGEIDKS